MSSVVLNAKSDQLYANGAVLGASGLVVQKGGAIVSGGRITATTALTITDSAPSDPATTTASFWTTYAEDVEGGGLNPNQLQKFAYCDPLVAGGPAGSLNIQQYEQGAWSQTSTTAVAPSLAPDAVFVNRPVLQPLPVYWGLVGTYVSSGTFTTIVGAVVVPAAGITANSVVRIYLIGVTAAALNAALTLAAPTITIQVGETTDASTFTATAAVAGWTYGWEILYA